MNAALAADEIHEQETNEININSHDHGRKAFEMKRQSLINLAMLALSILLINNIAVGGVWEDEFPITQDPVYQYRQYPAVAPDDTLYMLWPDWTVFEDTQIMLTKSPDRGQTWLGPDTIFSGMAYEDFDLLANAEGLHLLFVELHEHGVNERSLLFHTKSLNGGDTWTTPVRIGDRESIASIKLFSDGGDLFVYAMNYDYDTETRYNYLYHSNDGGVTWPEEEILPGTTVQNPDFLVDDNGIHMVYGGLLFEPEIMYCRSTDAGANWTTPVAVSMGAGVHAQLPQIAIDDSAIHVCWDDDREEYYNTMYSRSTNDGLTWSIDQRINDTFYGARARLLADEEGLHLVWCQYHGDDGWPQSWGSGDYGIIWYKFSDDSGLTWTDEYRVSQNEDIPTMELPTRGANRVKLSQFSDGFCATWQDRRDGNMDIYMRNYFGPACLGDVDGDGDTDLSDLAELLAAYGASEGDPGYNPDADFDANGMIDLSDLAFLLADYGCGS